MNCLWLCWDWACYVFIVAGWNSTVFCHCCWKLVLLSTAKELPATLLLAPPGFSTLATRVWQAAELAAYEDAAVYALVLVAISAALTWFLVVRPALRSWNRPADGDATDAVRLPPEPVAG